MSYDDWKLHNPYDDVEDLPVLCGDCTNFEPCPCGTCNYGWCIALGEYFKSTELDTCDFYDGDYE